MDPKDEIVPPTQAVIGWLWHGIMAAFALGFFAWAGVVWNATDLVKEQQVEIREARADIATIQSWQAQRSDQWAQQSGINASHVATMSDLQAQIDRRFKAIEENQVRVLNRLDDISNRIAAQGRRQ